MLAARIVVIAFVVLAGCGRAGETPRLTPLEERPVEAVSVGDANEAALLVQELALEPVLVEAGRLYFIADPELHQRLREVGYAPERVDMMQVERRTVRVARRGEERELLATGVRLINREDEYWIVNGTLAQLAVVRERGYRVAGLGPDEPRPREVLVRLDPGVQPTSLTPFGLNIYSVHPTETGLEVAAGAFDAQIDALRAAGFHVERISTVP
jgi:hypothetical protein